MGIRSPRHIIVKAAPQRSRGCAEIGERLDGSPRGDGRAIVIAIAPPSRFRMRRLARVFEHEVKHTRGYDHEDMPDRILWSLGDVPAWARGARLRYLGRAPDQIP